MRGIKLAENIGFCSGVKRAIAIVEDTLSKSKYKVYSLGQVIHNPEVIRKLEQKNLYTINSLDNIDRAATLILPTHGSPRWILNKAKKNNLRLIDTTCPYVSLVQKICKRLHRGGFDIVIVGERSHPEIKALLDLAPDALTIESLSDIKENIFSYKKLGIISQTTQTKDMFFKVINKILQKNPLVKEVRIFNTICLDTTKRQDEVKKLAGSVDALLVIGSRTSANTKRLLCIGRKINKKTYLIQNKDECMPNLLKEVNTIGVISGASTPEWLVEEIIKKIREATIYGAKRT